MTSRKAAYKNMGIIKDYIDYLKDNPEGYWFKKKLYGWGWTPARWQGWVVIFVYIVLLMLFAFTVDESSSPGEIFSTLFLPATLLSFVLIGVCYKKGEKPTWMWGLPKDSE